MSLQGINMVDDSEIEGISYPSLVIQQGEQIKGLMEVCDYHDYQQTGTWCDHPNQGAVRKCEYKYCPILIQIAKEEEIRRNNIGKVHKQPEESIDHSIPPKHALGRTSTFIPKNILRAKIQETEAIITTIEYPIEEDHMIQYFTLCDIMHFMSKGVLISLELVKLRRQVITTLFHHGHMHKNTSRDFVL